MKKVIFLYYPCIENYYIWKQEFDKTEKYYLSMVSLNHQYTYTLYSFASYKKKQMLYYLKKLFFVDKMNKSIILKDKLYKKYQPNKGFRSLF